MFVEVTACLGGQRRGSTVCSEEMRQKGRLGEGLALAVGAGGRQGGHCRGWFSCSLLYSPPGGNAALLSANISAGFRARCGKAAVISEGPFG